MRTITAETGKLFLFALISIFMGAFLPFFASADSYGDKAIFNVDKNYDLASRSKLSATLIWAGSGLYFYVDDQWWNGLSAAEQAKYNLNFQNLDLEFSRNIRPKLTALFGSDVNPTVSQDGRVMVLVHPMVKDAGGYISTGDGYSKYQVPTSNEREMVYFNTRFIESPLAKAYLAHEFTHLITFNQKDRLRNVADDVWLNEARADYSSTIVGYDNPYEGSNFEQRVKSFAADSSKSLVDWANKPANYGAAHLFIQYLVEQYGMNVLADSMATDAIGISSINYSLKKQGYDTDFNSVYRDWLVALFANDCRLGPRYCYKFSGLQNFNVAPRINYLPNSDQLSLSVMYNADYFSGGWQKIVGGGGNLTLDFSSKAAAKFSVPYLLCYAGGAECKLGNLAIDNDGKATFSLPDFGRQYASLTLMPFATGKINGFDDYENWQLPYSFKITISPKPAGDSNQETGVIDQELQSRLMAQIEMLKKEIARIQTILAARASQNAISLPASSYSCQSISANLYFGVENYSQVVCLQQFLKAQGAVIYPSGAITGRFSIDTQAAVARFQEKYAAEILIPLGLAKGTGYVGSSTKAKINLLLN